MSRTTAANLRKVSLNRANKTEYGDYKPSNKLHDQSAGARRNGDNRIQDFPDVSVSNDFEATGNNWAGTKKGTR
jgi:hypothetical protein